MGDLRESEDTKAKLLIELLEFCTGSLITLAQDTAHGTATFRTRYLGHTYTAIERALVKVVNYLPLVSGSIRYRRLFLSAICCFWVQHGISFHSDVNDRQMYVSC